MALSCSTLPYLVACLMHIFMTAQATTNIRINGTSSTGSVGRIEVFYNGTWGTVCDDGWDINDARVACQQLGFSDAVAALQGPSVDHGTGKIWLQDVACSGNESSIFDCAHSAFGKHDCIHNEDAGVNCSMPDELKAEVNCTQNVILKENDNFSCRCKAVSVHLFPTATWIKSGQSISRPSADGDQQLSLSNVGKDASGTYKCRAQLYTLIVEKCIEITVQYPPRIIYFHAIISKDGSMAVLTCHAEGLPKPNYAIYSDALEIKGILNGVAIIRNCSLNSNTRYTCTAWNNLGKYKKQLSRSFSKMITCSQPPIGSSG